MYRVHQTFQSENAADAFRLRIMVAIALPGGAASDKKKEAGQGQLLKQIALPVGPGGNEK